MAFFDWMSRRWCKHCAAWVALGTFCTGYIAEQFFHDRKHDCDHTHTEANTEPATPSMAAVGTSGTSTTTTPAYMPGFTTGPPMPGAPWFHGETPRT